MNTTENTISKKDFIKILIIIIVCISVGAILFTLWNRGTFLPRWIVWQKAVLQDASGQYEITLARKKVSVSRRDGIIWNSPKDVKVQKVLSCDIDHDGQDELVLLCWKRGHYGDVKPIWVEADEQDWVQHIFVYEYFEEGMVAKWMSSYIGRDITDIAMQETDTFGVLLCLTETVGEHSYWVWDSWGFTKIEN